MEQIRFKTGEFQNFTATRSFALGNFNVRIEDGTDLEFDGSTVRYAGATYPFPQLRGALSAGWIVLSQHYDTNSQEYGRPAVAGIQVRSATQAGQAKTLIATVEQDEQVVMSTKAHASKTRTGNRRVASEAGSDGVPVRTLKTPTVSGATDVTSAAEVLKALDRVTITPGQGVTLEQSERMTEQEREQYLAKKNASRGGHSSVGEAAQSGKVVAKVKSNGNAKTATEGMTVSVKTGGGIETWDSGEAEVVAKVSSESTRVVEDGITFTTTGVAPTQAPKRVSAKAGPQPSAGMSVALRLKIARAMCQDFPESYDFAAPPKKKLARLQADFEDRFDILRAVFAAEEDLIKSQILELFPQAFA